MYNLTEVIIKEGRWNPNAAFVSQFSEAIDFYVASQTCRSFLITAVTSSFGWWLAFFVADQNSIYYMPDERIHGDKVPSKELFLWVFVNIVSRYSIDGNRGRNTFHSRMTFESGEYSVWICDLEACRREEALTNISIRR
ncbi:hypothetical protein GCK32_019826 [Trichostrongylus colubriformis]|uniref:Uncharacterized protein n=1 Tax=Trichostrongylus colubriformis TaxID=6319 RepID=A0AAN8IUL1_TRICO